MPTYTYTLKDFVRDGGGIELKVYKAQCRFNNKMERIYADKASTLRLFYKACRKAEREKTA